MNERTHSEELLRSLSDELAQCRERERQFEMVFHSSSDGLVLYERDKRGHWSFLQANDATCRLLGYSTDELRGRPFDEFVVPEEQERFSADLGRLKPAVPRVHEQTLLRKDGSKVPVEIEIHPFAHGDTMSVAATLRALRAPMHVAGEPARWQALYGRILDNMVEGVWVADPDDIIFYANNGMAQIAGIPNAQIVGANVTRDFPELTLVHFKPFYFQAKASRRPVHYDAVPVTTPAGRPTLQSGWLVPLWEEDRFQGVICTVEDVTERKRSEQQLASDLAAMNQLRELGTLFVRENELAPVLEKIVDAAIDIADSDFGDIQLLDPATGDLHIVAQRGFPTWWLEFWNKVAKGQGSCGTALERGERVIVEDVEHSPIFIGTPALQIQKRAGVRAVQSTPLISRSGQPLGIFSTHYKTPHRPNDRALRLLDLLARQAADIIERAHTLDALRIANARYQGLVNANVIGVVVAAANGEILEANDCYLQLIGRTREEFLAGKIRWTEITPPKWRHADEKALREMRERGIATPFEKEYLRPDGSRRAVYLANFMLSAPREQIFSLVLDITERQRAEATLRESEERLRLVTDAVPALISYVDAEERYQFVNATYEQWFGVSRNQLIGRKVEEIIGKEAYLHVRDYTRRALAGERVRYVARMPYQRGPHRDTETVFIPHKDEHGKVLGVYALIQDVSELVEHKRSEEALRASEDRYRRQAEELEAIYKSFPIGLTVLDTQLRYTRINERLAEINGIPPAEHVGKTVREVLPAFAGQAEQLARRIFDTGEAVLNIEFTGETPAQPGIQRTWNEHWLPLKDERGRVWGINVVVEEITERRRAEKQINKRMKELRAFYHLSAMAEQKDFALENFYQELANVLPESWQYSDTACARIVMGERQFRSKNFAVSKWMQMAPIRVLGSVAGKIEVGYLEQKPEEDEGPFLKEERQLIDAIAERVGRIAERERAEEALRQASAYTRRLIEASLDPLVTISADGKITDVNEATVQATGVPRDRLLGSDFSDYFTEPDKARAGYQEVFAKGFVTDYPLALRHLSGRVIDVLYNASVYRTETGAIAGVFAAARDVTERKRAEEALRQASAYTRSLIEASLDPLVTISADGKITDVNEATVRATGVPRDQLLGSDFSNYFTEPDKARAGYQEVFAKGFVTDYPLALRHLSGRVIDVLYNASVYRTETGAIAGVFAAARDITERKRAEESLERSERLLRTILEYVPVGIGLFDRDGRLLRNNPGFERILGIEIPAGGTVHYGEYKARWADSGIKMEPGEWASVRAVQRGETSLNELLEIDTFDGTRRTVLNSAVPVRDADGEITGAVAVLQDITELRRADRALREINAKLEQSLAELRATQQQIIQSEKLVALGTLAAGVAHELNNPLMGVMGYVTRSQKWAQDPAQREMLANASRELERMRDLIKNLLGFARPLVEGKLTPVSVTATLQQALALLRPDFDAHAITLSLDIASDLPQVLAKQNELQQVFINLLLNARDAVEQSTAKEIRIRARHEDGQVVVAISDSGPGIPSEIQGRIFDPFFTTKPPGKGTGLGLSIARNIMADLRGTLTAESTVGAGATFTVALRVPPNPSGEEHGPTHDE